MNFTEALHEQGIYDVEKRVKALLRKHAKPRPVRADERTFPQLYHFDSTLEGRALTDAYVRKYCELNKLTRDQDEAKEKAA